MTTQGEAGVPGSPQASTSHEHHLFKSKQTQRKQREKKGKSLPSLLIKSIAIQQYLCACVRLTPSQLHAIKHAAPSLLACGEDQFTVGCQGSVECAMESDVYGERESECEEEERRKRTEGKTSPSVVTIGAMISICVCSG